MDNVVLHYYLIRVLKLFTVFMMSKENNPWVNVLEVALT